MASTVETSVEIQTEGLSTSSGLRSAEKSISLPYNIALLFFGVVGTLVSAFVLAGIWLSGKESKFNSSTIHIADDGTLSGKPDKSVSVSSLGISCGPIDAGYISSRMKIRLSVSTLQTIRPLTGFHVCTRLYFRFSDCHDPQTITLKFVGPSLLTPLSSLYWLLRLPYDLENPSLHAPLSSPSSMGYDTVMTLVEPIRSLR